MGPEFMAALAVELNRRINGAARRHAGNLLGMGREGRGQSFVIYSTDCGCLVREATAAAAPGMLMCMDPKGPWYPFFVARS